MPGLVVNPLELQRLTVGALHSSAPAHTIWDLQIYTHIYQQHSHITHHLADNSKGPLAHAHTTPACTPITYSGWLFGLIRGTARGYRLKRGTAYTLTSTCSKLSHITHEPPLMVMKIKHWSTLVFRYILLCVLTSVNTTSTTCGYRTQAKFHLQTIMVYHYQGNILLQM